MILGLFTEDWPYVIKQHDYSEQSPVDISTKHAQRRFMPFLRCFGYWAFDRSIIKITNNGHTGMKNWMLLFVWFNTRFNLFVVRVQLSNNTNDVPFITGGPLFDSRYLFEEMHFHWGPDDCGSEHEVNGAK